MHKISIINMKGGVGKTTLTVNLAYVLAKFHQKKVLLIDLDPQFNASQYLTDQTDLLTHFEQQKTVYDILVPKREQRVSLALKKKHPSPKKPDLIEYIFPLLNNKSSWLHLIPGSLKLINFEPKRGTEYLLKKFIDSNCAAYDFVLIDCPPTLSILTLSAFLASDKYLIPIKPDYLSSLGLPLLERGLSEYEETFGHKMDPLGIVFTLVDNKSNLSRERMEEIKSSGRECFESFSSHSTKVAKSVVDNYHSLQTFHNKAVNERYSTEFKDIAEELLNIIEL